MFYQTLKGVYAPNLFQKFFVLFELDFYSSLK